MKLKDAIASAPKDIFSKPLLYAKFDKRDRESEKSLYWLKKMKRDKKKDKSRKYLEKILFMKSRMF